MKIVIVDENQNSDKEYKNGRLLKSLLTGIFLLLSALMISLLTSCGKDSSRSLSEEELIQKVDNLISGNIMSAEPEQVDSTVVLNSYKLSDSEVTVIRAYMGTGVSAEEIVLFKCTNVNKVKESVDSYLSSKKQAYDSYLPEESKKIENAVVRKYNEYILVCIANDSNAAKKLLDD